MDNEHKVLTTGRLDGLVISPIQDESGAHFLDFAIDTLPRLRLVVEADAARELRGALAAILGPGTVTTTPEHDYSELALREAPAL